MKKKLVMFSKTTRVLRVAEVLACIMQDMSDEEIVRKFGLTWKQIGKVYSKLFYGGFLNTQDLARRIELRKGRSTAHIPLVEMESSQYEYECGTCGFISSLHFSECPRCKQLNLRRLVRKVPDWVAEIKYAAAAS
jgi:hypothetical protein